jgi:hypothetical protein
VGGARGDDDVRRERDQFGGVFSNVVGIASGPAVVDPNVASDLPAELLQPLQERRVARLGHRVVRDQVHECADLPNPGRLLCVRQQRPGCDPAEDRYELAPPHVMIPKLGTMPVHSRTYHTRTDGARENPGATFTKKDGLPGQARQ